MAGRSSRMMQSLTDRLRTHQPANESRRRHACELQKLKSQDPPRQGPISSAKYSISAAIYQRLIPPRAVLHLRRVPAPPCAPMCSLKPQRRSPESSPGPKLAAPPLSEKAQGLAGHVNASARSARRTRFFHLAAPRSARQASVRRHMYIILTPSSSLIPHVQKAVTEDVERALFHRVQSRGVTRMTST
ncbi:hypothetical protein SERLA73DRAFT_79453 [Serpula lacrymans var. lacrymans S7.3]|uniref:Uncharacterized protein n=1 Tax=Serpula lacrymans var. lacrymans (strain S7.3) TaxID=936435 RepID=F8QGG8_SERL3|nr:hypothetical protein SERLA73DRAFT_79453 [Serpula lacrymans var. lacrymans S7.3]